jgi:hypothetical protein
MMSGADDRGRQYDKKCFVDPSACVRFGVWSEYWTGAEEGEVGLYRGLKAVSYLDVSLSPCVALALGPCCEASHQVIHTGHYVYQILIAGVPEMNVAISSHHLRKTADIFYRP